MTNRGRDGQGARNTKESSGCGNHNGHDLGENQGEWSERGLGKQGHRLETKVQGAGTGCLLLSPPSSLLFPHPEAGPSAVPAP